MGRAKLHKITIEIETASIDDSVKVLRKMTAFDLRKSGKYVTNDTKAEVFSNFGTGFIEPRFELINGVMCAVFPSKMNY